MGQRLSTKEIIEITGVSTSGRQSKVLNRAGIHNFINAKGELIVMWCWVENAQRSVITQLKATTGPSIDTIDTQPDFSQIQ